MNSRSNGKLRKSVPAPQSQRTTVQSFHWLFRSNIPRKRSSYISVNPQRRNFFGMGEILGVLTNVGVILCQLSILVNLYYPASRDCSLSYRIQEASGRSPKRDKREQRTFSAQAKTYILQITWFFSPSSRNASYRTCDGRRTFIYSSFWG